MKFLFCFLLLPLLLYAEQNSASLLVGRWMGNGKNEVAYIQFDGDGFASFQIDGDIVGGKEFMLEGVKFSMSYTVTDSTTPLEVDLLLKNEATKEERTMRMIAKFYGKDSLQLGSNFNEIRPTEFTVDNAIMLERSLKE